MVKQKSHQIESKSSLMIMVEHYTSLRDWNITLLGAFVFALIFALFGWMVALVEGTGINTDGIEWIVIASVLVIPLFFIWKSVNHKFTQVKQRLEQQGTAIDNEARELD